MNQITTEPTNTVLEAIAGLPDIHLRATAAVVERIVNERKDAGEVRVALWYLQLGGLLKAELAARNGTRERPADTNALWKATNGLKPQQFNAIALGIATMWARSKGPHSEPIHTLMEGLRRLLAVHGYQSGRFGHPGKPTLN